MSGDPMSLCRWRPGVLFGALLIGFPAPAGAQAVVVVRAYLERFAALDPEGAHRLLDTSYVIVDTNGEERKPDRARAFPIRDWELGMHTQWSYRILADTGNRVVASLEERNDYWTLLGLGWRTQISEYHVAGGLLVRNRVLEIREETGTQSEALTRFRNWTLLQSSVPDPELFDADGRLRFDGRSAPKMRAWMERWRDAGRP